MDQLLTADEVAHLLRVTRKTIYNLTFKNKIPFVKAGGALRFLPSELEAWLTRTTKTTKAFSAGPEAEKLSDEVVS